MKGQALDSFLADHPCVDVDEESLKEIEIGFIRLTSWKMWFDGSRTREAAGAGVLLVFPRKTSFLSCWTLVSWGPPSFLIS